MRQKKTENLNFELQVSNGIPVISSRQVAEIFGKHHKIVLRDIRNLLSGNNFVPAGWFFESQYLDEQKKPRLEYLLTKDGFNLLAMGFTGEKATEYKVALIKRFNEMEQKLKEIQSLNPIELLRDPQNLMQLISNYAETDKQLKIATAENKKLVTENSALKPKAEFYDNVIQTPGFYDMGTVAKSLSKKYGYKNLGRNNLMEFLREQHIFDRKNNPYQVYVSRGLFTVDHDEKGYPYPAASMRGIEFIHHLLETNNITPTLF